MRCRDNKNCHLTMTLLEYWQRVCSVFFCQQHPLSPEWKPTKMTWSSCDTSHLTFAHIFLPYCPCCHSYRCWSQWERQQQIPLKPADSPGAALLWAPRTRTEPPALTPHVKHEPPTHTHTHSFSHTVSNYTSINLFLMLLGVSVSDKALLAS